MDVLKMKRGEVIEGLRPYVRSDAFTKIVNLPTPNLMAILTFHLAGGTAEKEPVETNDRIRVIELPVELRVFSVEEFKRKDNVDNRDMFTQRLMRNVFMRQ